MNCMADPPATASAAPVANIVVPPVMTAPAVAPVAATVAAPVAAPMYYP